MWTWAAFRERAERDFLPTVRDATADKYRTAMAKVETHLRPKLLTELTPEQLGRLAAALRKEPGRGGRQKSTASVASNMRHLKGAAELGPPAGDAAEKAAGGYPEGGGLGEGTAADGRRVPPAAGCGAPGSSASRISPNGFACCGACGCPACDCRKR